MELGLVIWVRVRVRVTVTGGNVVASFILRQVRRTIFFVLVMVKVRDKVTNTNGGVRVRIRNWRRRRV
jgi:hypothetical protein